MSKQPVVLVVGSQPGTPTTPLEVYLDQTGAESYIMRGLFNAFQMNIEALEPGGTLSLIVTRAPIPTEEQPFANSSGSFAINNPISGRHVWDFSTVAMEAEPRAE